MPQFDASGVVEGLECKLKPYADFEDVIPEPSDRQIGDFLAGLKKVMATAKDKLGMADEIDVTDPDQMAKALDALEPERLAWRLAGAFFVVLASLKLTASIGAM